MQSKGTDKGDEDLLEDAVALAGVNISENQMCTPWLDGL
jgi:hypothetical protein